MDHLRRSQLFVPGNDWKKIEKSVTLGADSIILDLEDSVTTAQKNEARKVVLQALQNLDFGQAERVVRINALETGLGWQDIAETILGRPDAYLIPKVRSAADVQSVARILEELETEYGPARRQITLQIVATETAEGVLNLPAIARASSRLVAMMWGAEDLGGELGTLRKRDDQGEWLDVFRYARSRCLLAAVAAEIDPIGAVYPDFQDLEGLKKEAQYEAWMGFVGKVAIHPKQVAPLNEIFTPSPQVIAEAQELLQIYMEQQRAGRGTFTFRGAMVDVPHLRRAQKVLERARRAGVIS